MTNYQPADAAEIGDILAAAAASGETLEVIAGATKRSFGRPMQTDHVLDLTRLAGVIDYDPAELLLTALPATPLEEITTLLNSRQQMLAFEPPDWRGLFGTQGAATLGGVLACNQSGPRRVKSGGARDHFLGFTAVNGWGDAWKAGGKVVKNVTGYDMCKLQAGAFGTLSVLTEVTVKVLPRPSSACTLVLLTSDATTGVRLMSAALNAPHEVTAAAFLPPSVAPRSRLSAALQPGAGATALRLEGPAPSVAQRAAALRAMFGAMECLDQADSTALWSEIATVRPLLSPTASCVWRVCPTPAAAAAMLDAVATQLGPVDAILDWGGGLVWISLDDRQAGQDGGAAVLRAALAQSGGHATLVVAPDEVRTAADVFQPLAASLAALSRRVKQGFDPQGILNPCRMYREF
jgi:glycolate oxidase FAD binding subunit